MSQFSHWSRQKLTEGDYVPKEDWKQCWYSKCGKVWMTEEGDWRASVLLDGRLVPVQGRYDSSVVAIGIVERTWQREIGDKNE